MTKDVAILTENCYSFHGAQSWAIHWFLQLEEG